MCERIAGRELSHEYTDRNRVGDHLWWISDLSEFQADYPEWAPRYDIEAMLTEIFELNREHWLAEVRA
jgi:CDP-paratose 2-epimerase